MLKDSYVPLGGFLDCAESRATSEGVKCSVLESVCDALSVWKVAARQASALSVSFQGTTCEFVTRFRCVGAGGWYRSNPDHSKIEAFAGKSLLSIEKIVNFVETEFLSFLQNRKKLNNAYSPSTLSYLLLHSVLFPFQIYLLSQAVGDTSCQRTESLILEGYLMQLLSSSVRILSCVIATISESPEVQAIVMTSLNETVLGVLFMHLLSMLYLEEFCHHIASSLRSDLHEMTLLWCRLMSTIHVSKSLQQTKDDLLVKSVYQKEYTTVPASLAWHVTLFHLLISTDTKYHFSCYHFNYVEGRDDFCCLLESYLFSGGLM